MSSEDKRQNVSLLVSGRIVSQLGDALITDEMMALNELIKNGYDADANFMNISINTFTDNLGEIQIVDDGTGMTYSDITEKFLRLGTDYKLKQGQFSPKYNRLVQGNKGIGRLSLQRLASEVLVHTCKEGTKTCYTFHINWELIEKEENVSDNQIEIFEDPNAYQKYFGSKISKKHGTVLILKNLKNTDFWKKESTSDRLKSDITSFIDPFNISENSFNISIDLNGLLINSETYDIELFRNTCSIYNFFEFNIDSKDLTININRSKEYFMKRVDKIITDAKKSGYTLIQDDRELLWESVNELNPSMIKKEIIINFAKNSQGLSKYTFDKSYLKNLPSDFSGEIFAFYNIKDIETKHIKDIETFMGIKLFRNGFSILPYGYNKNDWFNFTSYSQRTKSNSYMQHTTAGYVTIDGVENLSKIQELTNRQGILEDDYGLAFLSIIQDVISRELSDQDVIFREFTQWSVKNLDDYKKKGSKFSPFKNDFLVLKKATEDFTEAEEKAKNLLEKSEANNISSEAQLLIRDIYSTLTYSNENTRLSNAFLDEKEKRIEDYTPLLGMTLISESLAHEILRQSSSIKAYASKTISIAEKSAEKNNQIIIIQKNIITNCSYIARYASILDKHSYSKRRVKKNTNVRTEICHLLEYTPLLEYTTAKELDPISVNYKIIGDGFQETIVVENLLIAIENMIINSVYWLVEANVEEPTIFVEFNSTNKTILFYDNGWGIDKEIEETLFNPFISAKRDGRGIGLYIVKELLAECNASIQLLPEQNSFGNQFKFSINFGG